MIIYLGEQQVLLRLVTWHIPLKGPFTNDVSSIFVITDTDPLLVPNLRNFLSFGRPSPYPLTTDII